MMGIITPEPLTETLSRLPPIDAPRKLQELETLFSESKIRVIRLRAETKAEEQRFSELTDELCNQAGIEAKELLGLEKT